MSERQFVKGDIVQFQFGVRFVQGTVKEDRGPIGVRGRRLYLVQFPSASDADSLTDIELPAQSLELVRHEASAGR